MASQSFTSAESPTGKTLYDVAQTLEGPYAVGGSGDIYARRADEWEPVLQAGVTAQSKTLYGADVSDDGRHLWVCGGNGVVGRYDVVEEQLTDYSQPNGVTNGWNDIAVTGASGAERITVVNTSAQLVTATVSEDAVSWGPTTTPNGGAAIYGVDYHGAQSARFCDGGGNVYETTDGGDSWTNIGVDGVGKTFYDIASVGPDDATVVGGSGRFVEYDGSSWSESVIGSSTAYTVERDGVDGLAAGGSGYFYERSNGSWERSDSGVDFTAEGVAIDTGSDLIDAIVGGSGTVLERGDYAATPHTFTIESTSTATTEYAFDVYGLAQKASAANTADSVDSGCGCAEYTYDVLGTVAGTGDTDSYDYANDLAYFSVETGSADNIDLRIDGRSISIERISEMYWDRIRYSPTQKSLNALTDTGSELYAAGGGGHIVKRSHGSWSLVNDSGPTGGGNALYSADSTDAGGAVWVSGGSGALGRLDPSDDSLADHSAPTGSTSTLEAVAVTGTAGSETIHVANSSGELLTGTYSDGSVSWGSPIKPGGGNTLKSLSFVDASLGFACDTSSSVFKTTDGGSSWTKIGINGGGVSLYDVVATAADDVLVAGGSGFLFRYNGEVWTKLNAGGNTRTGVDRLGDRGALVGGNSVFSRTLEGWTDIAATQGGGLNDVILTDYNDVTGVAVGGGGTIVEQGFLADQY